jgi:hypothetical protein
MAGSSLPSLHKILRVPKWHVLYCCRQKVVIPCMAMKSMLSQLHHLPVFKALSSPEVARCTDHDGVVTMTTQTAIRCFQADSTPVAKRVGD